MSGELIVTGRGKVPQRAIRFIDELPYVVNYVTTQDFGAADSFVIKTPASRRAKVIEIGLFDVTETFNSVTTSARVDIGDGSDANGFGFTDDFADGTASQVFTSFDGSITPGVLGAVIEAGDLVTLTAVAPTGGTPTGIGQLSATFSYFQ